MHRHYLSRGATLADKLISNDSSRLVNTTAGGTTTDVGVLVNGLPRPAAATVDIAGVRTNFALPDVLSTGSPDHYLHRRGPRWEAMAPSCTTGSSHLPGECHAAWPKVK